MARELRESVLSWGNGGIVVEFVLCVAMIKRLPGSDDNNDSRASCFSLDEGAEDG